MLLHHSHDLTPSFECYHTYIEGCSLQADCVVLMVARVCHELGLLCSASIVSKMAQSVLALKTIGNLGVLQKSGSMCVHQYEEGRNEYCLGCGLASGS